MRSSSPGFQPDRPGQPGFQLAEDGGFQTQTPAVVGDLELVLSLDGATSRYSPRNSAVGDLALVLSLDATTRGPRDTLGGVARPARRGARHYRVDGDLEVVLLLNGRSRYTDAIERDDEEVLLLLAGDDDAALLMLIAADDRAVARRRERGG